jgi:hypothetical protein
MNAAELNVTAAPPAPRAVTATEVQTMSTTDGSPRRCSELQRYEVRVQGHLNARWTDWVDGLALTREVDGTTSLSGPPMDQAALHGLLARIRDLGLPIVSLRRGCPDSEISQASEEGPA